MSGARERIVRTSAEKGRSSSEVARRFGVSRWRVRRHLNRAAAGSLAPTPRPGRKQRLARAHEVLRRQVEAHHDWTLEQHAALADTTGIEIKSSVGTYLKRLVCADETSAYSSPTRLQASQIIKITLIGAGSTIFAKNLIGDILSYPELGDRHDRPPARPRGCQLRHQYDLGGRLPSCYGDRF